MSQVQKYKLLKDLPWLKAGTILWVQNGMLNRQGCGLSAECYEATMNYFWVDEDGRFDENADPTKEDSEWLEKVVEPVLKEKSIEPLEEEALKIESSFYNSSNNFDSYGIAEIIAKQNKRINALDRYVVERKE